MIRIKSLKKQLNKYSYYYMIMIIIIFRCVLATSVIDFFSILFFNKSTITTATI